MIKATRQIIHYFAKKPRNLFLTDSLGALLTTFLLFVVLRNFPEHFGMPKLVLTYLSGIAACLCLYSTVCFYFLKDNWTPFIRGISIANLLYCMLTMGLLFIYFPQLTIIGLLYFLMEIVIILGLVFIEGQVVAAIKNNQ